MSIRRDKIQLDVEINGQKAGKNFDELLVTSRNLNRERRKMIEGTDEYIKKTAELKKVNDRIASIRQEVRGTVKEKSNLLSIVKKLGPAISVAFVLAGVRKFFGYISEQVSQIDLLKNKFTTVFGDAAVIVEASAERQAVALGLTQREYKKLAANAGDLLIPMQFQREEAAKLSTDLVSLSGALSAWTGGQRSSAEVSDILTKALLGEREQLKTLGISIQEADVKARLAEKGQSKLTGTFLQQAKALATLELITEKSTDAQASFKNNAEGLIQTKARVSAKIREISQRMAKAFVPVFERGLIVVEKILAGLISFGLALSSIPKFVKDNRVAIGALIVAMISLNTQLLISTAHLLKNKLAAQGSTIATTAMAIAQRGLNVVMKSNPIGLVISALSLLVAGLTTAYKRSDKFKATIHGLGAVAKETFTIIKEAVGSFVEGWNQLKEGNVGAALKSFATGIKKSNPIGIAFSEGKRLKEAFNSGYKESIIDSAGIDILDGAQLKEQGKQVGNDTGDAIIEGINERLSSAPQKEKAKKTKKEKEVDPTKLAIDKLKAEGAAKLELLKIQLLEEKLTQEEHDTQVRTAREANLQKQLDTLASHGKLQTSEYRQTQLEQLAVIREGTQAKVQAQMDELDRLSHGELSELQKRFLNKMLTEQELEEQSLQARSEHLIRMSNLLKRLGLEDTAAFREVQSEQVDIQNEFDQKKIDNAERTAGIKQQLFNDEINRLQSTLDAGLNFLSQDKAARKKHASAIKAFEVGKVAVNLASELQGIFKSFSSLGPYGTALAVIQAGFAVGRAAVQTRNIKKQKFYRGGYIPGQGGPTGDTGTFHDGQDYVADVDVHVGEHVTPKWQVRHPVYGRVVKWLDAGRKGQLRTSFMDGGFIGGSVSTDPVGIANLPLSQREPTTGPDLNSLLSKMDQVMTVMLQPRKIKAEVAIGDIEEAASELNEIRNTAGF